MANTNPLHQQQTVSENPRQTASSIQDSAKFRFTFMNRSTPKNSLETLLNKARSANTFTLSTGRIEGKENDFIIKIQFLHATQRCQLDVLLFYTHQLLNYTDESFSAIQAILKQICQLDKKFHGWNFTKQHLDPFVRTGYLSQSEIDQIIIIDLQDRFKQWYNKIFPHNNNCPVSSFGPQSDDLSCTCLHRPYKDIEDKWTICTAFRHVFWTPTFPSDQRYRNHRWQWYYYILFEETAFNTFLVIVEFNWDFVQLTRYKQSLRSRSLQF